MGFFKNKDVEDTYMEAELHEEVDFTEEQEYSVQPQVVDEEERREVRRKRRVRNEILVYMTSLLVLALVAGGVFTGVRAIQQFRAASVSTEGVGETESTDNIQNMVDSMLASESELPTEVIVEVKPEEKLDEYIDTVIAGMSLEEKVLGLIITSPEELTGVRTAIRAGAATQEKLEVRPVGGLVYYRRNIESEEQLKEMLSNTASYSKYPIFLAVNEGGDVNSSVQNSVITVPEVTKPGHITSAEAAGTLGGTIGSYLKNLNFNVNFAPTADILYETKAAVADYCFGGDAAFNAELVAAYVTALEEQGISATLKTFPGTGHLTGSTVSGTVSTDKSRADYEENFTVFKAGIDAGADFVMVSNMVASELSGGMDPCSMSSSVVTDILRTELGFTGIIITEPMNVKAITDYYSAEEAAVAALKAGCDMILLPEDLDEAYMGILEGIGNGSVAEARINDSLKRVLRVKYAYKLSEFTE
ncbi:MAG: glycoside hydrolase family 3 protein [Lachnospiraceae bacterium]|nr:glycoside hydrolase family 3 protein [Lachnospiraceae bacterium]